MALLTALLQGLSGKATGILAATALTGGGVALAVEAEPRAEAEDAVASEEDADDPGDDDTTDEGDETAGDGQEDGDDPDGEGDEGDDPDGEDDEGEDDGGDEATDDEPTDDEPTDDEPGEGEDDGARSARAREVHGELTGEEDLSPGDEGFGRAVSERARQDGSLGQQVRKGGDDRSDEPTGEQPTEPEQGEAAATDAEAGRPDDAGPPARGEHDRRGRGNGAGAAKGDGPGRPGR